MTGDPVMGGRLHPVTPWRRTLTILTALVTFFFRDLAEWWSGAARLGPLVLGGSCAGLTILAGLYGWLAWRVTWWELTDQELRYRHGLLWHTRRSIEIRHVQGVDVDRPFWGRLMGVCVLTVQVAGDSTRLSYLSARQANALRIAIRPDPQDDTGRAAPDGAVMARVSGADLATALLLDLRLILTCTVTLAIGALPFVLSGEPLLLLGMLPSLGTVWRLLLRKWPRWYGWTLTRTDDGYHVQHGMFDRVQRTHRLHRVQCITLRQPVLWRRRDWVSLSVAMAGSDIDRLLIPVVPRRIAEQIAGDALGDDATLALRRFVVPPRTARWCAPLVWRSMGYALVGDHFSGRRGRLLESTASVCHLGKVQTVETEQGMWQRRWGLASFGVWLSGNALVRARYRPLGEARHLAQQVHDRVAKLTAQAPPMPGTHPPGHPPTHPGGQV